MLYGASDLKDLFGSFIYRYPVVFKKKVSDTNNNGMRRFGSECEGVVESIAVYLGRTMAEAVVLKEFEERIYVGDIIKSVKDKDKEEENKEKLRYLTGIDIVYPENRNRKMISRKDMDYLIGMTYALVYGEKVPFKQIGRYYTFVREIANETFAEVLKSGGFRFF